MKPEQILLNYIHSSTERLSLLPAGNMSLLNAYSTASTLGEVWGSPRKEQTIQTQHLELTLCF